MKRVYFVVLFLAVMTALDTQGIAVRTVVAAVLPAPTLSSPGNGSTLTTFGPTLTWNNPSGTTQYHLQVIPANGDGPGIDVVIGSAGTSFQVPAPPGWYGLLPDMTYTWRVRVTNAQTSVSVTDPSWSPWAERRFRTPAVSSATLALTGPGDGFAVTTLRPTLQWSNSRKDVFYYEVQASKDATFTTDPATATAAVYSALIHGGVTTPPNSYTIPVDFPLEDNTKYSWRVRPRVQGDGKPVSWSKTSSFTTTVTPWGSLDRPLVVAQYYAWYDVDTFSPGNVSDIPISPYNSDDVATLDRHARQARQAGIDALAISWLGPSDQRTTGNLRKLLGSAAAQSLRVSLTFETDKPQFGDQQLVIDGLKYAQERFVAHPNWLRYQGRPVFFFWRPSDVARPAGQTPLVAWQTIRDQVDPQRQAIWIMEGLDFSLLDVFDGQFGYSIAWSTDVSYTLSSWAKRVRARAEELGQQRIFVGTVMPGYDDTRVRPSPEGFSRDREGGAYFAQTWDAAIAAGSDWINLTSFNEWIEGSQIEPSISYGDQYLALSKEWSDRYRGFSQ